MSESLLRPERFERLSIFFPMWNEEQYIHRAVRAAKEICDQLVADNEVGDYELIVVDDASTDRTAEYADELVEADHRIRVVHHDRNRKLGGSIKSGFAAATGDVVLYTDADLPFEMIELVRALRVLRNYEADMVSAYRLDRTGEGLRRAVYSWVYNWLIQLSFGTRLRDINFAFKLCRRRVLEAVTLSSEGSFIDAELVIRAQKRRFHDPADRRRLLPPHPRGVHPVVAGRHPHHARRDDPAPLGSQGVVGVIDIRSGRAGQLGGRRPTGWRRRVDQRGPSEQRLGVACPPG